MASELLIQQGWYLTEEGKKTCSEGNSGRADAIIKVALNTDLRDIGHSILPEDISRGRVEYLQGPYVLQIQKIRNVAAPKENEEAHSAPRMFRISFTDGHTTCHGIETEKIEKINFNTAPGTKVKLIGMVALEQNFLLLTNKNVTCLGGRVDTLAANWEFKKTLATQSRTLANQQEGGPPPFVPFGKRIAKDKPAPGTRDTFKSLDTSPKKKNDKVDGEFEQQRKATIAEALQSNREVGKKTFGAGGKQVISDSDVARLVEMGFPPADASAALRSNQGDLEQAVSALTVRGGNRGRGQQRGGPPERQDFKQAPRPRRRDRDEEDEYDDGGSMPSRPSGPATLFDFLNTKITVKEEPKTSHAADNSRTDFNKSSRSQMSNSSESGSYNRSQSANQRRPYSEQGSQHKSYTSSSMSSASHPTSDYSPGDKQFDGQRKQNLPPRFSHCRSGEYDGRRQNSYDENTQSYDRNNRYNNDRSSNYSDRGGGGGRGSRGRGGYNINRNYSNRPYEDENYSNRNYQRYNRNETQNTNDSYKRFDRSYEGQNRYDEQKNRNNSQSSWQNNRQQQTDRGDYRSNNSSSSNNKSSVSVSEKYNNKSDTSSSQYSRSEFSEKRNPSEKSAQEVNTRNNKDTRSSGNKTNTHNSHRDPVDREQDSGISAGIGNGSETSEDMSTSSRSTNSQKATVQVKEQNSSYNNSNINASAEKHIVPDYSQPPPALPPTIQPSSQPGAYNMYSQEYPTSQPGSYSGNVDKQQTSSENRGPREWKRGDRCMAKYEGDGQFYAAIIEAVSRDLPTCVVMFLEYGNSEEVQRTDMQPISSKYQVEQHRHQVITHTPMPTSMPPQAFLSLPPPPLPNMSQGMLSYAPPSMPFDPTAYMAPPGTAQIQSMEFHRGAKPTGTAYARQNGRGYDQGRETQPYYQAVPRRYEQN